MDPVIARLLAWLVIHSGFPQAAQPPAIEYRPAEFFAQHICGGQPDCTVHALYLEGTRTILLHDKARDLQDLRARSLVVHELVHYLQHLNGAWAQGDCQAWAERERQAFALQLKYFWSHGGTRFAHAMPLIDQSACEQARTDQQQLRDQVRPH